MILGFNFLDYIKQYDGIRNKYDLNMILMVLFYDVVKVIVKLKLSLEVLGKYCYFEQYNLGINIYDEEYIQGKMIEIKVKIKV